MEDSQHERDFKAFVELHKPQLQLSAVPEHYWEVLHVKLYENRYDANETFTLFQIDYENTERGEFDPPWQLQISSEDGVTVDNPRHIYLIDHAWTFKVENAKKQLDENASLKLRMASIVGLQDKTTCEDLSEHVFNELWRYCNCYWTDNLKNSNSTPIWYMLDEVGSAILHSETPNFCIVPFLYFFNHTVYSIMFPVSNSFNGDIVTRNFVEKYSSEFERTALLIPWIYTSFLNESFLNIKPSPDYFLSGHVKESLPILENLKNSCSVKENYKVYAEYSLIQKYLTDKSFEIVLNEDDADILWYTKHFKDFASLSETPHKYVNQFPFEYVITIKDLLCIVCRHKCNETDFLSLKSSPPWLPITYNLKTEVRQFVTHYQIREREGLDNHWIIKPFNLARGMDTHITKNINFIIRLQVTGPKIVQKYIHNPVLFYRPECNGKVKFDIRYIILLKNVSPLQVYLYKNFFLRFSNQPFEMRDFEQYTKHFTVMNYIDNAANLKQMLCQDFKNQWEQQYPNNEWQEVEKLIIKMLKEVFECAIMEQPPCGISASPQSRALYAADIMLEWDDDLKIQPKLLEINWTPDCERACEYYPDFFNDIFKLLFLNVENTDTFYIL